MDTNDLTDVLNGAEEFEVLEILEGQHARDFNVLLLVVKFVLKYAHVRFAI